MLISLSATMGFILRGGAAVSSVAKRGLWMEMLHSLLHSEPDVNIKNLIPGKEDWSHNRTLQYYVTAHEHLCQCLLISRPQNSLSYPIYPHFSTTDTYRSIYGDISRSIYVDISISIYLDQHIYLYLQEKRTYHTTQYCSTMLLLMNIYVRLLISRPQNLLYPIYPHFSTSALDLYRYISI